jgi:hypothetical protein
MWICSASAEVAFDAFLQFFSRRIGVGFQKGSDTGDESTGAVSAHHAVFTHERG